MKDALNAVLAFLLTAGCMACAGYVMWLLLFSGQVNR